MCTCHENTSQRSCCGYHYHGVLEPLDVRMDESLMEFDLRKTRGVILLKRTFNYWDNVLRLSMVLA